MGGVSAQGHERTEGGVLLLAGGRGGNEGAQTRLHYCHIERRGEAPREGAVAHAVAKAAVEAFVRVLAVELGPSNIRVNAVAPGFTRTDATAGFPEHLREAITSGTPMGRVAEPGDIAHAILALAGGMGFVTGICLPVDGGVHLV